MTRDFMLDSEAFDLFGRALYPDCWKSRGIKVQPGTLVAYDYDPFAEISDTDLDRQQQEFVRKLMEAFGFVGQKHERDEVEAALTVLKRQIAMCQRRGLEDEATETALQKSARRWRRKCDPKSLATMAAADGTQAANTSEQPLPKSDAGSGIAGATKAWKCKPGESLTKSECRVLTALNKIYRSGDLNDRAKVRDERIKETQTNSRLSTRTIQRALKKIDFN
jgi:hypothetical protein